MKRRVKIPMRKSKRIFSKHAVKTHKKNRPTRTAMRGGIRM